MKYKIFFKDEKGNRYTKEMEYDLPELYEVEVIQHRDYMIDDEPFRERYLFDNVQDADDKVRFINEEWKNPPMGSDDKVYLTRVCVPKTFMERINVK